MQMQKYIEKSKKVAYLTVYNFNNVQRKWKIFPTLLAL